MPNTQVMFKKWLNVFKMAILMYPLCGALGGISTLIKGIVIQQKDVHLWMMVVAMIAPFLPFFLLPSLLKGTIAALERIGGALTTMGMAWRGGIKNGRDAVHQTEAYKDAQRTGTINMAKRSNQRFEAAKHRTAELSAKNPAELSSGERRELSRLQRRTNSSFGQRQYAMNAQAIERGAAEDVEATRIMMRGETGNYNTDIMGTQLNELLTKLNTEGSLTDGERNKARALSAQLASQTGSGK